MEVGNLTILPGAAVHDGKAKKPKRKIGKILFLTAVGLAAAVMVGKYAWVQSGSDQWKLEIDKNGTKVYSLKSPGSNGKKFRATRTYSVPLHSIIAPFFDEGDEIKENCEKWLPGCTDYKILQSFDTTLQTNAQLWTFELFPPFSPREMLLQGRIHRDSRTGEVTIENIAIPNRLPPTKGAVRMAHLHNIWHYTPLENGDIHIEFIEDFSLGGMFPTMLMNLGGASTVFKIMDQDLPKLFAQEKYKGIKFDFLEKLR